MNESYAEASCKRKDTIVTYLLRSLLIVAAVLSFLLTFQSSLLLLLAAIFIVLIYYIFPRLSVEYEYIFCDGQLDFDKIMGNAKRKAMLRIDFENVEIMAPEGSHSLDSYTNQELKVRDYTSRAKDVKPYVVIVRSEGTANKILFEPNEKMLQCIKTKAPRKLVEY